jgi:hypothetical protein
MRAIKGIRRMIGQIAVNLTAAGRGVGKNERLFLRTWAVRGAVFTTPSLTWGLKTCPAC